MKIKRLGYGLSAVALAASMMPVGSVFAESGEACTAELTEESCVATSESELVLGLANTNIKNITIGGNISAESTLVATHGVTINGSGRTITSSAETGLRVGTAEAVVLDGVTLVATAANSQGIRIQGAGLTSYDVTLNNTTVRSNGYGIMDVAEYNGARNGKLTLTESNLQWVSTAGETVKNIETDLSDNYSYGFYSYGLSDAQVKMTGVEISGYRYANSIWHDADGASMEIFNSEIYGRTAFDTFAKATEEKPFNVTIMNSRLHGINLFGGSSEDYANVLLDWYDDTLHAENTKVTIRDADFTIYENSTALEGASAGQYAISNRTGDVEGTNNTAEILGLSTYIVPSAYKEAMKTKVRPQTGNFAEDWALEYMTPAQTGVKVWGGRYSYNPTEYVGEGVAVIYNEEEDIYTVVPPATTEATDVVALISEDESSAADENEVLLDATVQKLLAAVVADFDKIEDGSEIVLEDGTKMVIRDAHSLKETLISGDVIDVQLERAYADQTESMIANGQQEIVDALEGKLADEAEKVGIFDYSILLSYNYAGGAELLAEITELAEPLKLSFDTADEFFEIPEAGEGLTREYTVIRYHEGVDENGDPKVFVDELETELDEEGLLTFTSDKFSAYLVAYVDTVEEAAATPETGAFTGEAGSNVTGAIVVSVVVAAVVMVFTAVKLTKR